MWFRLAVTQIPGLFPHIENSQKQCHMDGLAFGRKSPRMTANICYCRFRAGPFCVLSQQGPLQVNPQEWPQVRHQDQHWLCIVGPAQEPSVSPPPLMVPASHCRWLVTRLLTVRSLIFNFGFMSYRVKHYVIENVMKATAKHSQCRARPKMLRH